MLMPCPNPECRAGVVTTMVSEADSFCATGDICRVCGGTGEIKDRSVSLYKKLASATDVAYANELANGFNWITAGHVSPDAAMRVDDANTAAVIVEPDDAIPVARRQVVMLEDL